MIPATCPHGKDPRMCAYCDKKDTCDCRCDKNTDVIWGEITGELKDQTDLQAALDKHTADILTVDTLAHSNEQRLDTVEGTANEANQRSKDNMKRLDRVEGIANGAQALANNHTELINKVEATADGKADKVHTHTSIGTESTSVEADGSNVKVYDGNGVQVFKTLNKFNDSETRKRIGVEFRSSDDAKNEYTIGEVTNKRTFFKTVNGLTDSKLTLDSSAVLSNDDKVITLDGSGAKIKSNIGYVEITSTQTRVNHKNKVAIGIDGYNIIKVNGNETVLENAQTKSMGLRLKADQSELKFNSKGITVTKTETKVTSAGKVELLAPSVEARDNVGNPIFSTGRYTKNGSTTNEKQTIIFIGNKQYQAGDGTSAEIVLNGNIELCTALQSLQSCKRTRFGMPMTVEWIFGKGKLLNEEFCEYLYNAITQYYGNYDYENDGNSEALRMLSGENIYPVILSKYYHVGEATAHAQHFKPWQVEFYDEIQSYDGPDGIVSIPVIRIHIGEDFAEWLVHAGYKGLSEKVSYLEFGIGRDEMSNMPFSIYNASGTKLQEFTLI